MPIEVVHLTHCYSEGSALRTVALNDVSFRIEDGEFVGIIGHTGSGKSTLVQHLNGLLKPASGQVLIDGEDLNGEHVNRRALRQRIGLVFRAEGDILGDGLLKQLVFRILEDQSDPLSKGAPVHMLAVQVFSVDEDLPGGGFEQPVQMLDKRGFAAAGMADDADEFPVVNAEGHIVEGDRAQGASL